MRVHFLQHEEFEHPAYMGEWVHERGHVASTTRVDKGEVFPDLFEFDMLIILGGLESVYDIQDRSDVQREMTFIRQAVDGDKFVLGFCFGAQLLSASLGGKVSAMPQSEIGWHEMKLTEAAETSDRFKQFPDCFMAPVWHGDTFSIPPNAEHTIFGKNCRNQGFMLGDRVFGFQVLLHMTRNNLEEFMKVMGEPVPGPNVQPIRAIRDGLKHVCLVNGLLAGLLDQLSG